MADRGFPAPHDGFCDLCSKPIAAGDRVCLLGWSEWAHKACVDARPVSIPLPPEPPHDRVVEAVDQDGKVVERWRWDGEWWCYDVEEGFGAISWDEIVRRAARWKAMGMGWTLQHLAAECGEQT